MTKPHEAYDEFNQQMIATANAVKDRVRRDAEGDYKPPPKPTKGAMIGTMNKFLGGDDMRKIVFAWLFADDFELLKPKSSKTLTDSEAWALINWLEWWQDDEEQWHVGDRFTHEAICVLNAAIRAYNRADRSQQNGVDADNFALARNLTTMGGVVVDVQDEVEALEELMSKIDKDQKEADDK